MIYLKHPKHGSKVAIAEAEAEYDESNGWVRYTVGTLEVDAAPVANELEVRHKGRPPRTIGE